MGVLEGGVGERRDRERERCFPFALFVFFFSFTQMKNTLFLNPLFCIFYFFFTWGLSLETRLFFI